jgi:FkbM family methyltransferase
MNLASLKHTLRYINRFGLRPGLQAGRLHGDPGATVAVELPRVGRPIWVRTGTSDVATFSEVFVAGQYDLPVDDFAPAHILDLGANVGYASVCFAARWPRARVLALEPSAQNFALLQRNVAAWPSVTAIHGAVWSHAGSVRIANPDDDANAFRMGERTETPGEGEEIPAFTVPQLMTMLGCVRVDLLKMDVEGAEAEILRGRPGWLDAVDVLVIELHDRIAPGCSETLYEALRGRHFAQEISGGNLVIDLRGERRSRPSTVAAMTRANSAASVPEPA